MTGVQTCALPILANRVWDEPFFSSTVEGPGRVLTKREVRDIVADAALAERSDEPGDAA